VRYGERQVSPLAVLWHRTVGSEPERTRILPDGCLDLIYTGDALLVAGPDPDARWHDSAPGTAYVGLRLFGGLGAATVDVPATELVGRTVEVAEVLPGRAARLLTDRVEADPAAGMLEWVRARRARLDPTGPRVLAMARSGLSVAAMADELGCSSRQVHRRCLPMFGYGPRRLGRVVRMQDAVARLATGAPLADVAAAAGYADQPHLTRELRDLTGGTPAEFSRG
jgi:AraC-like DNA-binding protein